MDFRLVSKSVTLNDLESRNGRVVCVISPNSVAFGADYVTDFLPRNVINTQTKHDGRTVLFAVAELRFVLCLFQSQTMNHYKPVNHHNHCTVYLHVSCKSLSIVLLTLYTGRLCM